MYSTLHPLLLSNTSRIFIRKGGNNDDHKGRQMADELSILELRGLLKLRAKECRNWVRRHVPAEAIRREGSYLYIALWGVNAGLSECVWRPDLHQPRGYQGCPGRLPVNVNHRDSLGRFISQRAGPRLPKHREFTHPARRRYLAN